MQSVRVWLLALCAQNHFPLAQVERGKQDATRPFARRRHRQGSETLLECPKEIADLTGPTYLPMPRRPRWYASMTADELEAQEQEAFHAWLSGIEEEHPPEVLRGISFSPSYPKSSSGGGFSIIQSFFLLLCTF